jgi:hypothetical protein
VSSVTNPSPKTPIARGVQSIIDYGYEGTTKRSGDLPLEGEEWCDFRVYSTPRQTNELRDDGLAFAPLPPSPRSPSQFRSI